MAQAKVRGAGGAMSQTVEIRTHLFKSDVPASEGGEDAGPTPHELLAAALACCTAMTLRVYSKRKQWPLTDCEVTVAIDHIEGVSVFSRKIKLVGSLDEEQHARLLKIADACPVHKTLSAQIEIRTELLA